MTTPSHVCRVALGDAEEDEATRRQQFVSALQRCLSKGLTGVQTNDERAWDVYRQLQDAGR